MQLIRGTSKSLGNKQRVSLLLLVMNMLLTCSLFLKITAPTNQSQLNVSGLTSNPRSHMMLELVLLKKMELR